MTYCKRMVDNGFGVVAINVNGIKMDIRTYKNKRDLAIKAAQFFINVAQNSILSHGRFTVCLAGGSTPLLTYEKLIENPFYSKIEWSKVHFFWGDERYVPQAHPDSNYRMVKETLLDYLCI